MESERTWDAGTLPLRRGIGLGKGRVTGSTDPLGNATAAEFDAAGRLASRTHPDGTREAWAHDVCGNLVAYTNEAGFETKFEYGPFRRVTARVDPDGARYEFVHDHELRIATVKNPLGATWSYHYDEAGNLTSEEDFNGRRLSYAFDASGRLIQRTNGVGETVRITRDAVGQVVEQLLPAGGVTRYEYDANGELLCAANESSRIEFVRDLLGRVIAETINGKTLLTEYDAVGNQVSRTTPSGRVSNWQYDAAGRPLRLDAEGQQISFGHDVAGRETYRWISDETALTSEWDPLGRLTARRLLAVTGPETSRSASTLREQVWTYRADGNPESVMDAAGSRTFTLDPVGRVTAVNAVTWTEQYAYDAAGNLTHAANTRSHESATTGAREISGTLVRRAGRTTYEYDGEGRLIRTVRRTLSGGRKTWTYSYDEYDHMTSVVTPTGQRWQYIYDPVGRRVAKRLADETGALVEEIRFVWDGTILAEQEQVSLTGGFTTTTWDYEQGSWTPLAQDRRSYYAQAPREVIDRQFHAIVSDLVGTPIELVTPDGAVAWRRDAVLWGGLPEATADQLVGCPLRFPGQYHDPETGLDYNFLRYYDSDTGHYTTPDPLGLAPAPNHHGYVRNPLSWMDPLGLTETGPSASGGQAAQAVGLSREQHVAELVGGTIAKDAKGQDIKITMPGVGSSGLDVVSGEGDYVFVGGPAKAKDLSKFGKALKINKYAADQAGVKAKYYLEEGTPEPALRLARKYFGDENVHTFKMPCPE